MHASRLSYRSTGFGSLVRDDRHPIRTSESDGPARTSIMDTMLLRTSFFGGAPGVMRARLVYPLQMEQVRQESCYLVTRPRACRGQNNSLDLSA